ncbi:hypothetical protein PCE1_000211 [Barthelona sp. PCE]
MTICSPDCSKKSAKVLSIIAALFLAFISVMRFLDVLDGDIYHLISTLIVSIFLFAFSFAILAKELGFCAPVAAMIESSMPFLSDGKPKAVFFLFVGALVFAEKTIYLITGAFFIVAAILMLFF